MRAGILAAGSGSRFLQAGWKEPKPLVRLQGLPIIHHVLTNLIRAGAEEVDIFLNGTERFDAVEDYLGTLPQSEVPIRITRKTTQSSFETFSLLMKTLGRPPFVISTVDAILDTGDLRAFLDTRTYPDDCVMALAVTDYVNDEKPLWVDTDPDGRIRTMGEEARDKRYATAGLYLVLQDLETPSQDGGFTALRHYLKNVVESGRPVWAQPFRVALDIDEPGDVTAGEEILERSGGASHPPL